MRAGCSRPARVLAARASSYSFSSQTMIMVKTMPIDGLPALRRASSRAAEISPDVRVGAGVMIGHGRRQLKPSRASISFDPAGPHEPGSYGSGMSFNPAQ